MQYNMKKIKGFTLLEMIIVITIIWIVWASVLRMKNNTWNKNDIWREATNVIYKEMNQYVKDFQRNKIWEDWNGNEHEIKYFYLNFNNTQSSITWNNLTIWNRYISEDNSTWYFEWTTLITNKKYSAFQVLKWSNNYTFYTRNLNTWNITSILISNNWKIYTGDFHDIQNNNFTINESDLHLTDWPIYKFLICWWYWKIKQIWVISINAVTKVATLDRCEDKESKKYAGIDCDKFAICK